MFINIIPQSRSRIITRFGRPVRVQTSGPSFRFPILEQVAIVPKTSWSEAATDGNGTLIHMEEKTERAAARECITRDNVKVEVSTVIRWRIVDPIKAVYEVDDFLAAMKNAVLSTLRTEIGKLNLDDVLSARQALTESVISSLSGTSRRWGVQVMNIEILELNTDEDTSKVMLQQADAEREKRAIELKAEGAASAVIKAAEAEKQAAILKAHAIQESLAIIADAEKDYLDQISISVGPEAAVQLLMTAKVLEGYKTISANPSNKVYLPNDIRGFLDSVEK